MKVASQFCKVFSSSPTYNFSPSINTGELEILQTGAKADTDLYLSGLSKPHSSAPWPPKLKQNDLT